MADEKKTHPFSISPVETSSPGERPLVLVNDRWMLPAMFADRAADIYNFPISQNQIWVVGFPRSGTTMLQELVWLLNNNVDFEAAKMPGHQRVQFLDSCFLRQTSMPGDQELADTSRNVIKTHLAFDVLPPKLLQTCKVVFIARNPKDAAVSFFHFRPMTDDFKTEWERLEKGKNAFGPFWDFTLQGWAKRNDPNVLFLFYEDTQRDMKGTILKVAKHLGQELTEEQISQLENYMNIDSFKKNKAVNHDFMRAEIKSDFIRKGGVGGWRDFFTKEMEEKAEEWTKKHTEGTDFTFPEH